MLNIIVCRREPNRARTLNRQSSRLSARLSVWGKRTTRGLLIALVAVAAADAARGTKVWRSGTFMDRVDGTLGDGGANTYVAADGSVRIVNLTDLNGDGNIDLVAPPDHTYNQVVGLAIYWARDHFAESGVTMLPSDGGGAMAIADLNGDGHPDLVLANRGWNAWRPIDTVEPSTLYWGSAMGYSADRRTELSAESAFGVAIGDLDGDGSPDIVFANIGNWTSRDFSRRSFVFWGDHGRYDDAHRTELETEKASDVVIADVNADGRPDVLFAMLGDYSRNGGVKIYYGSAGRESFGRNSTMLHGESSSGVAVGDINGDGIPDIAVASEYHTESREANGIYAIDNKVNLDSYIFWGSRAGYSDQRRTALPTLKAMAVAIGDLNGDGRPDVAFANNASGYGYGAVTGIQNAGDSCVYWNGPDGFQQNHRLMLPTIHATDCTIGDVNGDGVNDLVFANDASDESYDVHSFAYLGAKDGLDAKRLLTFASHGAGGIALADCDGDGKTDVVVGNLRSGRSGGAVNDGYLYWGDDHGNFSISRRQVIPMLAGSYSSVDINADGYVDLVFNGPHPDIYWGGPKGFSEERKSPLSNKYSFQGIFADFNRDGYLDALPSEWAPGSKESSLYFGGPSGFAQANRFGFRVSGERLVAAADLNRDGWLDAIFPTMHDSGKLLIFWGARDGFDNERRTELPVAASPAVRVADLNNDGHLDLVVANLYDPHPAPGTKYVRHAFGGSTQGNTYVYWGSADGFSAANRQVLETIGNEDVTLADFNNDGLIDIVASHYSGSPDRKQPSYLFWNSPSGFASSRATYFETDAACGVMSADFNLDGYRDIRFANHVKDGDHRVDTFIYWNSASGFAPDRRLALPAPGNHFLAGVDIGNIYDRSDRYDYTSPPFDTGGVSRVESVRWDADVPFRTAIEVQVRTAPTREALSSAAWTGPDGARSAFKKSGGAASSSSATGRWIQYKATLISPNDANSPILRAVTVSYGDSER